MHPEQHLGHYYGPAPTDIELGLTKEKFISPDDYCEECD